MLARWALEQYSHKKRDMLLFSVKVKRGTAKVVYL